MNKPYHLQKTPFRVPTTDGKLIEEHFGLSFNNKEPLSLAHMVAPAGWSEPFQSPKFDEYTYVIKGKKQVIINDEKIIIEAGQSIKINKNTKVQYSNPFTEPCEYLAICLPAFSLDLVHREK